jgi:hypothetical protein
VSQTSRSIVDALRLTLRAQPRSVKSLIRTSTKHWALSSFAMMKSSITNPSPKSVITDWIMANPLRRYAAMGRTLRLWTARIRRCSASADKCFSRPEKSAQRAGIQRSQPWLIEPVFKFTSENWRLRFPGIGGDGRALPKQPGQQGRGQTEDGKRQTDNQRTDKLTRLAARVPNHF